jgi:hypothetical protein
MWVTFFNLFKTEYLVLWVRSEMTDLAIDLINLVRKEMELKWATREKKIKANAKNRKKASKHPRRSGSKKKIKKITELFGYPVSDCADIDK